FSDHPRCVCEVVGAFLRGWNDRAGYSDRQRLHPYAMRIVGTAGDADATRRRRDLCLEWAGMPRHEGAIRRLLGRLRMRIRIAWLIAVGPALALNEGAGAYAARACFKRGGVDEAFALLDRLLDFETGEPVAREPRLPVSWAPATLSQLGRPRRN